MVELSATVGAAIFYDFCFRLGACLHQLNVAVTRPRPPRGNIFGKCCESRLFLDSDVCNPDRFCPRLLSMLTKRPIFTFFVSKKHLKTWDGNVEGGDLDANFVVDPPYGINSVTHVYITCTSQTQCRTDRLSPTHICLRLKFMFRTASVTWSTKNCWTPFCGMLQWRSFLK